MGSYQQQIKEPTSQDHAEDVLYTIKKSDYVGRYIVASRDIKPGENIFSDKPACIGRLRNLNFNVYIGRKGLDWSHVILDMAIDFAVQVMWQMFPVKIRKNRIF